jgi:L-2-hydroxyglutarate oxidase LhgO
VIVAETTRGIGNGVSSRNSEVIHGGMYYPTGSLRAQHCPRGRRMMYEFCASHGVPHRKCGKLIVATEDAEVAKMEAILKQGIENGVEGFTMIDGAAARAMEPALNCVAALHSPETGIVDSHSFMRALQGDLEDRGGVIAFGTTVEHLSHSQAGWLIRYSGSELGEIAVDAVINAAGLGAQPPHRGLSAGAGAAARARPRQLFRLRGTTGVFPPDLSGAAYRRRARHPCHPRLGRSNAFRARRGMGRGGELRRQCGSRSVILRRDSALLAGVARRHAAAGLRRYPA